MEDFYWLLDHFWDKTYQKFVAASKVANMSSAPSVILWSSEYLHHHKPVTENLVERERGNSVL